MLHSELQIKYDRLRGVIRSLKSVAVAFSAGVDSTLMLKVSLDELGPERVRAVTGKSESLAVGEFEHAIELAKALGAVHVVLDTTEFDNPDYTSNPTNRCYYCKQTLYSAMTKFIADNDLAVIINGINADDHADFRPGIIAAGEHAVRCPATEVGMTKADIRALSAHLGLPTFDKPASPCLSSRVQYGEEITPEKLRRIESCERLLKDLGFEECRVRHHNNLARIEVPANRIEEFLRIDLREQVTRHFAERGYAYVTVDLLGFRSGSMNEVIAFGRKQPTHT